MQPVAFTAKPTEESAWRAYCMGRGLSFSQWARDTLNAAMQSAGFRPR